MNHKVSVPEADAEGNASSEYAVHRSVVVNIVAVVVCLALAVLLWAIAMNAERTVELPLRVSGDATYTVSASTVKVTGSVVALRGLKEVSVSSPHAAGDVLCEADLTLPEGVHVVDFSAVVVGEK